MITIIGCVAALLLGFALGATYYAKALYRDLAKVAAGMHMHIEELKEDPEEDEMTLEELKDMLHQFVNALFPIK